MDGVWLFNPVATLSGSLCAIAAEARANSTGASPEDDLSVHNKPQADMRVTSGTALETVVGVDVIPSEACQASASASANPSQPAKKKAKKKRASRVDGKKASKEEG